MSTMKKLKVYGRIFQKIFLARNVVASKLTTRLYELV
jgi:hypothetical protein